MDISIRIAGPAGGGLQTTADILGRVVTRAGLYAFCFVDAESRIRGGLNFSQLRISQNPVGAPRERVDVLVAHSPQALERYAPGLPPEALVLSQATTDHPNAAPFLLADLARQAGSAKAAGTVAVGALVHWLGMDVSLLEGVLQREFGKNEELLALNLAAAKAGADAAANWEKGFSIRLPVTGGTSASSRLWLSGSEAVALGAVAGGVSFFAGYPMSPATGIMAALAGFEGRANLHVEQAEDEIAAINMVAGASYAGARAMTATSGGGYDLMTEGVSLIGMIEVPAVINISQRPGPATGLPTRVSQGDLNLARHTGHGFFPRILLAPRSIRDAFEVTARAFDLAELYQVPVFILTDQHLNDSQITCEVPDTTSLPSKRHLPSPSALEALPEYRRYTWSDDGVSPMALPGKTRHLVYADSDEHSEEGHITESAAVAERMSRKRIAKLATVTRAAWPCEAEPGALVPLIVSWGSTYEVVREAVGHVRAAGLACSHLHLRWLWPVSANLRATVEAASRVIVVEASVGAELASVLQETTLRTVNGVINRLDGHPFEVESLTECLKAEVAR